MGDSVEHSYDYDAPKFIDFTNLSKGDEDYEQLEEYFNFDHENGVPLIIECLADSPDGQEKKETCENPPKRLPNLRTEDWGSSSQHPSHQLAASSDRRSGRKRKHSPKTSKPGTPNQATRSNTKPALLSTEEQQLQKMKQLRQQLAAKRKLAQKSCREALKSQPPKMLRSDICTTKPEEFHFATDSRLKNHQVETGQTTKDQPKSPVPQKKLGRTIPKPFNLHESKRKKEAPSGEPEYVPMALTVTNFSKSTPARFRTRPANKPPTPLKKIDALKMTVPHTPNFQASRQRPTHIISAVEKEEQLLQDMAKNQFKATRMNKKIFDSGYNDVRKITPKPATVLAPFDLETHRPKTRAHTREESKEREFHAQPFPEDIFKRPMGIKKAEAAKPTIAASPAFASKKKKVPTATLR